MREQVFGTFSVVLSIRNRNYSDDLGGEIGNYSVFHAFCQCAWSKKEGKNLLVNGSFYIFAAEFVVLAWIQ